MTEWLIDKSALARIESSPDSAEWEARISRGLVRVSTLTLLEFAYSVRNAKELRSEFSRPPIIAMPVEHFVPSMEDRGLEVIALLAERGYHRAPSISDLLIAAIAEIRDLTVLHLDKDFELISEITGQQVERIRVIS